MLRQIEDSGTDIRIASEEVANQAFRRLFSIEIRTKVAASLSRRFPTFKNLETKIVRLNWKIN